MSFSKPKILNPAKAITPQQIADAVEDMGFDAEVIAEANSNTETLKLTVTGMTCASCVRKIEMTLGKVAGIEKAVVALTTSSAVVTFRTGISYFRFP